MEIDIFATLLQCSVTCGKGKKTRTVKCVNEKGQEVNEELCKKLRPKVIRRCRAGKCPRWRTKDWGEVGASSVVCSLASFCINYTLILDNFKAFANSCCNEIGKLDYST